MSIGCIGERSTRIFTVVLRHRQRSFATSTKRPRNLLARYAPPPAHSPRDPFETISTIPVSSSIQEVSAPSMTGNSGVGSHPGFHGGRLALPLPAMLPLSGDREIQKKASKQVGESEMTVQGVHIPPKPIPPGEEGKSRFHPPEQPYI